MYLLITFIAIAVISLLGAILADRKDHDIIAIISFVSCLIFATVLLVVVPMVAVENSNFYYVGYAAEYNALTDSMQRSRGNGNSAIERAGLINKITETNQELAKYKARSNDPWVGAFYNDKIAEFDYLE